MTGVLKLLHKGPQQKTKIQSNPQKTLHTTAATPVADHRRHRSPAGKKEDEPPLDQDPPKHHRQQAL